MEREAPELFLVLMLALDELVMTIIPDREKTGLEDTEPFFRGLRPAKELGKTDFK